LKGVLDVLLALVIFAPYLFGLGFSFYRFGAQDGAFSVIFPPYAWYRGISYLWVEPEWKEGWDLKAGNLALIVMYASSTEPQVQYELRQHESKVKEWLKKVPDQERMQLRSDADALGAAAMAFAQELVAQMSQGGTLEQSLIKSPSIQRHVKEFEDEKGFMEVWRMFEMKQRYALEVIRGEMDKRASEMDLDKYREKMLEFWESQGMALMKLEEQQLDMRIEKLFDER
jgi:hypothetical protein